MLQPLMRLRLSLSNHIHTSFATGVRAIEQLNMAAVTGLQKKKLAVLSCGPSDLLDEL
jgi:hypothetical protein